MMNKDFWKKVKLLILDWDMETEQLQTKSKFTRHEGLLWNVPHIYIELIASPGIASIHSLRLQIILYRQKLLDYPKSTYSIKKIP